LKKREVKGGIKNEKPKPTSYLARKRRGERGFKKQGIPPCRVGKGNIVRIGKKGGASFPNGSWREGGTKQHLPFWRVEKDTRRGSFLLSPN